MVLTSEQAARDHPRLVDGRTKLVAYIVIVVAVPLGLASTVLTFKTLAEGPDDQGPNSTVVECS